MRLHIEGPSAGMWVLAGALTSVLLGVSSASIAAETAPGDLAVDDFMALVRTNLAKFQAFQMEFRLRLHEAEKTEPLDEVLGTWSYRSGEYERLELSHVAGPQAGRHEEHTRGPQRSMSLFDKGDGVGGKGGQIAASGGSWKAHDPGMPRRFFLLPFFLDREDLIRKTFRFEGSEDVSGRRCLKISYLLIDNPANPNLNYRETYWLDLERDAHVLRFEWEQGGRLISRMSEVRLHQVENGLWFPVQCRIDHFAKVSAAALRQMTQKTGITFKDENGEPFEISGDLEFHTVAEIQVDASSIKVDVALDEKGFDIKFPLGTHINDTVEGKIFYQGGIQSAATGALTPSPTAETLDEIVAKAESQRRTIEATSLERSGWGFWTVCLTAGGSVLAVVAGIFLLRRGR